MQRFRSRYTSGCERSMSRSGLRSAYFGRRDPEAVRQGLQLAVAALLAEHAEVVALGKQHVDDVAPELEHLRRLALDHHARRHRLHARGLDAPVDAHRADAAAAVRDQVLERAQVRNVDAGRLGRLQDRLAASSASIGCPSSMNCTGTHGGSPTRSATAGRRAVPRRRPPTTGRRSTAGRACARPPGPRRAR